MTTRGFKEEDFIRVAEIIHNALKSPDSANEYINKVLELTKKFPIEGE